MVQKLSSHTFSSGSPETTSEKKTAETPERVAKSARSERPARSTPASKRPPKNEGQWALGNKETPLNANEESKLKEDPLKVRERIENIYAKEGFDSIPKEDLRMRFRWWGLYTQRKEGYDGTWTGDENTDILEDSHFMLRIRIDGGQVSPQQLAVIGEISQEFARDTADLSDRENVQLHWIRVEDMPVIWRRLEEVGLYTTEACGDVPRVILGSPLAGLSKDEVIDPRPAIQEIVKRYIGSPEYSNLPRKFKTAISGLQDVAHETDDVSFVGVNHPEHGPGFDVWVGGGLSTNPIFGKRIGAWVSLEEVPDVWEAVVRIFRDYGYRRLRAKARLKFLVKDWGVEKFREVLQSPEYLNYTLKDGPAPTPVSHQIDHVGTQELKDGSYAVGVSPIAGRVSGTKLKAIADLAEREQVRHISFTPFQKIIMVGIESSRVDAVKQGLSEQGLPITPSNWRRNLLACSGIEFCKLSFTETRKRSQTLVPELEERLADVQDQLNQPITININGCPNSCARNQLADLGFKGQLVDDEQGGQTEGFQAHLGGSLGMDLEFGKKLRQHKVNATDLADYIEKVVRNYLSDRENDQEKFATWARRADEELLR